MFFVSCPPVQGCLLLPARERPGGLGPGVPPAAAHLSEVPRWGDRDVHRRRIRTGAARHHQGGAPPAVYLLGAVAAAPRRRLPDLLRRAQAAHGRAGGGALLPQGRRRRRLESHWIFTKKNSIPVSGKITNITKTDQKHLKTNTKPSVSTPRCKRQNLWFGIIGLKIMLFGRSTILMRLWLKCWFCISFLA